MFLDGFNISAILKKWNFGSPFYVVKVPFCPFGPLFAQNGGWGGATAYSEPEPQATKTNAFPKGGRGSFPIKNFYCKIWTFKQGFLSKKLIQNPRYDFLKMRGGSKAVLNITTLTLSLKQTCVPLSNKPPTTKNTKKW